MPMSTRSLWLGRIALALAGSAVGLGLAEVAVRFLSPRTAGSRLPGAAGALGVSHPGRRQLDRDGPQRARRGRYSDRLVPLLDAARPGERHEVVNYGSHEIVYAFCLNEIEDPDYERRAPA